MFHTRRFLIADASHGARATLSEHLRARFECVTVEVETAAAVRAQLHGAARAQAAARAGAEARFDAIFLETRLQDADGRELCRELRAEGFQAPIMMLGLSARESDVVWALDAGANDFLPKPYRPAELVARLRAQLRAFDSSEHMEWRVGELLFRPGTRSVMLPDGGRPVRLTDKEAGLLKHLVRAAGQPISRERLLIDIWDYCAGSETHTVETHIFRLRRKVEVPGCGFTIASEAGAYRLKLDRVARPVTPSRPERAEIVSLAARAH